MAPICTLIALDKKIEDLDELEFAGLRIRLPIEAYANRKMRIKIIGNLYQVFIEEYFTPKEQSKCRCGDWEENMDDIYSSNNSTIRGFLGSSNSECESPSEVEMWKSVRNKEDRTVVPLKVPITFDNLPKEVKGSCQSVCQNTKLEKEKMQKGKGDNKKEPKTGKDALMLVNKEGKGTDSHQRGSRDISCVADFVTKQLKWANSLAQKTFERSQKIK